MGRVKWTAEEDKLLCELYGTITTKELALRFEGHSGGSVRARALLLRNKGEAIAEKQERRLYDVNFDFFDSIGLEQCAFAGLVASDGCIHPTKNKVQVTSKDTDYLEDWAKCVGYTGPVHNYETHETAHGTGNTSLLLIHGVPKWLSVLDKVFNVTPRKSLTLRPPIISSREQVLAFMSGYIDGDGSIMYKTKTDTRNPVPYTYSLWTVAFCGTQSMCYWFKLQCDKFFPPKKDYQGVEANRDTKIWQFRIGGKRAEELMREILKLNLPRLDRKWDKFITWDKLQK